MYFVSLGNLTTIIALLLNPKLRSHATTAFVLSLCVSDLLFCTISMPLTAIRFYHKVNLIVIFASIYNKLKQFYMNIILQRLGHWVIHFAAYFRLYSIQM